MDFVREIPVECMTAGEAAGVWSGWSTYGDREVVREASAKGTHIGLAHKCLAYRRHCTVAEAQKYFSDEVEIWVDELLKKQQIHRASHILTNTGRNPLQFVREKCVRCREPKLRKYLANYVVANDGFEGKQEEAWNIINSITLFEEKNGLEQSLIEDSCIQEISLVPDRVKSALITELYFYTNEIYLSKRLKNTVLWDYLLSSNSIDLLVAWIDARYRDKADNPVHENNVNGLTEAFRELDITEDMIELIEKSTAANPIKELVLNRFSRHGVLTRKEKSDVKLTLSRQFSDCRTPSEFSSILSSVHCSVQVEAFFQKLFSILFYRTAVQETSHEDQRSRDAKVFDSMTEICKCGKDDKSLLQRGIVETVRMLSDDYERFLIDNPLIVLSLGYLEYLKNGDGSTARRNIELKDIFDNEQGLDASSMTISAEVLRDSIAKLPYLNRSMTNDTRENDITMYQLLNGYKSFDVQRLFKWRMRKEPMPNFTSESLIKKYGRREKLTYVYYLKEARPSMAAYVLQQRQGNLRDGTSSKMKYQAASYAHVFGLKNADDAEIMCSCVAFIEMLGVDSECLRLHATAADYVKKSIDIPIYELLESITTKNPKEILWIFRLGTILNHLENSFQSRLTIETSKDTKEFVEALKQWDFIVKFARAHNVLAPCHFLKFLAANNLWFEFVLVGHIFAYPLEQIMECAREFENSSMREHLLLALSNSHILTLNSHHHNLPRVKSRELFSSPTSQSLVEQSTNENDLWLIILKCHQSQDPPGALLSASQSTKSPVLTVLAACYEPSATAAYCYSWLVISVNNDELLSDYAICLRDQLWPAKRVSDLFRSMLAFEYVDTLSRGFQIFMPDNPLNAFFEFLVECINLGNFKQSREKFRDFVAGCSTLKSNKIIDWESTETDYLHNSYWISTVAVECTMTVLGKCFRSTHLQMKFLDILVECNINEELHVETPDFRILWEITTILSTTRTRFDFSSFHVTDEGSNVNAEIKRCIRDLVDVEDFNSALQMSKVAGLHCSKIIIAQYRSEFDRSTVEDGKLESAFWKRCAQDLKKYEVSFEDAAAFFVEHAEKVLSHKERYEILKLALQILEPIVTDKQTIDTVEMAMWKSCILAGPDSLEIDSSDGVFNKLKRELLSGVNDLQVSCTLNDTVEKSAVEVLINRFIAVGELDTALRISTIFNYKHRDLQILMLCLSLAEGEISPYQLSSQQKSLLSESSKLKQQKYMGLRNRGFQRRSSSSSLNLSSPHAITSPTSDVADAASSLMIQQIQLESLSLIEKLVKSLQNGFVIGTRVLLCIKLATYLRRSYQSLLTLNDPMQLLYEVVGSNCDRKLEMVGDIIAAYRIKNDMVAKFLAEEIVANTPRLVEEGMEDSIVMWGYPLGVSIQAIIDLCNDPSLLGWELLKTANLSLGQSHGKRRNVLTLKVVVELLIRSHDCFTASCSMEGIASVLRKSQHLANTLQQLKHWSLLVRLVTGLGRFTEMNYIFQILKEHDQFEFLLGKGLDKIHGLKTALMEFSKRQCPGNKELFTLIALHFGLYNEIALMWETEARDVINELVNDVRKSLPKTSVNQQLSLKFTRNENVEQKLQVAVENFTHATEYYLQDNKLNLAHRCSHQAQLAALQISLLGGVANNQQVTCLFNLSPEDVSRTMCQALTVSQSLILVRAYNHHGDWSAAVYNHVVVNGESRYLKEFLACHRLTPAIVQDCVCRYRSEKTITKQMTENMQMLVSELSDVECKYVLASQLGFKKIIEGMLSNSATGAYLKDTVWKQGFNVKELMGDNYRG